METPPLARRVLNSPLGPLTLVVSRRGARAILFGDLPVPGACDAEAPTAALARQLEQYFRRERTQFDYPLDGAGTEFQRRVWSALCAIPYGSTASYGAVARAIGRPAAARAVGAANRRNPLPILVPCHRVLGADGSLTGYAGRSRLDLKAALLELEGAGR